MIQPFFSIIILYWQNAQYLAECLASLAAQSYQDFEIILLDNGSPQPLDPLLIASFPQLKFQMLTASKNLGFSAGNNLAVKSSLGEYLVFLNADAFPNPDWLEQIRSSILKFPRHFFASRLISASDPAKLDGEWNVYHVSGLVWRKGHGHPVSKAKGSEREVFSACAAAGVYPRQAFELAGGFDEDFFAYMEDIDLDFRLQLLGFHCRYLPQAKVRHVGSGSTASRSELGVFHGHRNLPWVFLKDMPGIFFWIFLPCHLLATLLYILAGLIFPTFHPVLSAKWQALKGLPLMLKKRHLVQASKKVSSWQVVKKMDWNPFSPLTKLTFR